jgi:hypothetical protein
MPRRNHAVGVDVRERVVENSAVGLRVAERMHETIEVCVRPIGAGRWCAADAPLVHRGARLKRSQPGTEIGLDPARPEPDHPGVGAEVLFRRCRRSRPLAKLVEFRR